MFWIWAGVLGVSVTLWALVGLGVYRKIRSLKAELARLRQALN